MGASGAVQPHDSLLTAPARQTAPTVALESLLSEEEGEGEGEGRGEGGEELALPRDLLEVSSSGSGSSGDEGEGEMVSGGEGGQASESQSGRSSPLEEEG